MKDWPDIMTLPQVAEYMQFSLRYCYRLIREEGLPAVKLGQRWRVHRTELVAWLEQAGRKQRTGAE